VTDFYVRPGPSLFALTEQEAYAPMELFLAQFQSRGGNDLTLFRVMIHAESGGDKTDPAQWRDWLNCVRAVKGQLPNTTTDTWARLDVPPIHRL
jgi:hypothetical protein